MQIVGVLCDASHNRPPAAAGLSCATITSGRGELVQLFCGVEHTESAVQVGLDLCIIEVLAGVADGDEGE